MRFLQILGLALFPWVILPPPLTVWPDREGVWLAPKVFFLALLALLLSPKPPERKRPGHPERSLLLGMLAWLCVASLTTLPKEDWSAWLLGPVNRMDGPLYQLFLLAFALRLSNALAADPQLARSLTPYLLLSALFQGVLWLWQRGGLDPLAGLLGYTPGLPPGTLGNPGMAAGLALPLIPLALALWLERRERVWLLAALGLATALGGLANRSSLIALALALGVWVFISRDRRLTLASLAALALSYASSAYWPSTLPVQKQLASGRTLETRLEMWRIGLSLLQEPKTFLFGMGPLGLQEAVVSGKVEIKNLLQLFHLEYGWPPPERLVSATPLWEPDDPPMSRAYLLKYDVTGLPGYSKEEFLALQRLSNLDKAHNAYMDKALAFGIPFALLWTLFLLGPIPFLLRRKDPINAGLATGLLSLGVYYLTWFATPQTEPWHFALAVLAWQSAIKTKPPQTSS